MIAETNSGGKASHDAYSVRKLPSDVIPSHFIMLIDTCFNSGSISGGMCILPIDGMESRLDFFQTTHQDS